ncbi:MAG: single-stranded DNA-binding protein [Patescibacteria group bacterium]|jgi:single-strand DNA-binding protein
MNLNKAMIIGNLTKDPDIRTTPSGQTVTSFSVATNLIWTDANGEKQKKAEFHNIVAWRKLGEICGQYLHKGNKVYIEGRLQTRDWEGSDGVKRYRTEIVADNMIMLDTKGTAQAAGSTPFSSKPASANDFAQPEPISAEEEIQVENIPF